MTANLPVDILQLIEATHYDDAITALNRLIDQEPSATLYFERGKLQWKLGRRAEAITDYEHATALDATSPAAQALTVTRDIMDFYNKDLYNP
jgi:predicted negative regulator of RcsB-dependent stress response